MWQPRVKSAGTIAAANRARHIRAWRTCIGRIGMDLAWAPAGGMAGLPAGTMLRGAVFRLSVRSGEPGRLACETCGAPAPAWIATRCRYCREAFGVPGGLEVVTALVLALLAARFGTEPAIAAFVLLGALGVGLAAIDVAVQRLPDRLTLPAYPAVAALLAIASAVGHDAGALVRAVLGGAAMAGGYLVLAMLGSGQLGAGDIKLAGLVGLALGWLGWRTLFIGASLGFVLAAAVGVPLLIMRRASMSTMISFGPYLLGGALVAILTSAPAVT